jgi:hypothetical protein
VAIEDIVSHLKTERDHQKVKTKIFFSHRMISNTNSLLISCPSYLTNSEHKRLLLAWNKSRPIKKIEFIIMV